MYGILLSLLLKKNINCLSQFKRTTQYVTTRKPSRSAVVQQRRVFRSQILMCIASRKILPSSGRLLRIEIKLWKKLKLLNIFIIIRGSPRRMLPWEPRFTLWEPLLYPIHFPSIKFNFRLWAPCLLISVSIQLLLIHKNRICHLFPEDEAA